MTLFWIRILEKENRKMGAHQIKRAIGNTKKQEEVFFLHVKVSAVCGTQARKSNP
jgi:hypothetical protein